ncbi:MAG: 23S rRNA pseudouridine1911/1915/1917 synthase [Planctomycetota bacterium]|jgi:23S rRNA pseudouridine1911/1915/1917 synthase
MTEYITIEFEQSGIELDEYLSLIYPDISKGFLRREVQAGHVTVDGEASLPSRRLKEGETVVLDIDDESAPMSPMAAAPKTIEILYENDDVLFVNKPAGLAAEPERWSPEKGSLSGSVQWMAAQLDEDKRYRPRMVHRLDKDTTGVVVFAKNLEEERHLRGLFEHGGVKKQYLALVEGEHPLSDGEEELIDLRLGPESKRGSKQRVDHKGKDSQTRVMVERRFKGYTLMRCFPLTGRTHQIRVHLAETGFPLVVDPFYGRREEFALSDFKSSYKRKPGRPERALIGRLTLHAERIQFQTLSGETLEVASPLPSDFVRVLKQLAKIRPYSR